jgi:PPK2 family polyphosphate:nucleotide phosphotransferase
LSRGVRPEPGVRRARMDYTEALLKHEKERATMASKSEEQFREALYEKMLVPPGKKIDLKRDYDPGFSVKMTKAEAAAVLQQGIQALAEFQDKLYAQNTYSLLVIFQALDAAGKDGTIKHVMSGLNPQGCQVYSFKGPSAEELNHDYLWRCIKVLPERGRIGIFNRSYYEEVLVTRVHPEILDRQKLPSEDKGKRIWKRRFEEINNFEKYLVQNGTVVLKFFLNVSKKEQKKRFLERIEMPEKNWKFSTNDAKERAFWKDYMEAYEDMFNQTSTEWAPWVIVPADNKWFTRLAVAHGIYRTLKRLKLEYPKVSDDHRQELLKAREMLEKE